MVRRFDRSIYDELDELRASMDYLYQLALEPADNPLLPEGDNPDIVCRYLHNLNAEVCEHDDEVTVTVETVPGNGTQTLSAALVNQTTLKITCIREEENVEVNNGDYPRRQRSFSLHQVIPLPPVTKRGAKMSMRNGVLDLRFKKVQPSPALS